MKSSLCFVDASVFVHAYLKVARRLQPHEVQIKEAARHIVARINSGERVLTTVVHFGEIANILDDHLPPLDALRVARALCMKENLDIVAVAREDYFAALDVAETHQVGVTDALAYVTMKKYGLDRLYSFDRDFDRLGEVRREVA